jgi:hypothetical protein
MSKFLIVWKDRRLYHNRVAINLTVLNTMLSLSLMYLG